MLILVPRRYFRNFKLSWAALLLSALSLLICDASRVGAQDGIASPADEDEIQVRTDLVIAPVLVTDRRGRFVESLTANDFRLTDNAQPVTLAYFSRGAQRLALTLMFDTSGSMRDLFAPGRDAGLRLLERFSTDSRLALVTFDNRANIVAGLTSDVSRLRAQLPQLAARPNTRTAIFDSLLQTFAVFDASPESERRIIVLISDGRDTVSTTPPAALINAANARGISLYLVHIPFYLPQGDSLKALPPVKGITDIIKATGGKAFRIADKNLALNPSYRVDLAPVFEAIADDLQAQYVLGFYPTDKTPNTVHHLAVTLIDKKLRPRLLRPTYSLRP